ncbi:MAG: NUDIX hydrolase [Candidatus Bathyarchaeia archaeon]
MGIIRVMKDEKMTKNWIEENLYLKIREVMPIPTVDAVVTYKVKFLVLVKKKSPVKDLWWVPGGRVKRGESLEEAVLRKLREETGLEGRIVRRGGVVNQVFPEIHTISVFFHVEVEDDNVKLNEEHRAYKWFSKSPQDDHNYLKTIVTQTLGNDIIEATEEKKHI